MKKWIYINDAEFAINSDFIEEFYIESLQPYGDGETYGFFARNRDYNYLIFKLDDKEKAQKKLIEWVECLNENSKITKLIK